MRRIFLPLLLLLSSCASAPVALQRAPQADAPFAFSGRISLKQDGRRESAGVRWVHGTQADEILILAPLGQTVARIRRDGQAATLDASGKHYAAQDMEMLMQQVLGWQLPLSGMRYWVTALPFPGAENQIERGTNGQVSLLRQQGWEIFYTRYAAEDKDALPLRLTLKRDGMEVTLLIDEWEAQ